MALLHLPLDKITEQHLRELIETGARESLYIDYKRETYGGNEAARKEFLADICSFANAASAPSPTPPAAISSSAWRKTPAFRARSRRSQTMPTRNASGSKEWRAMASSRVRGTLFDYGLVSKA